MDDVEGDGVDDRRAQRGQRNAAGADCRLAQRHVVRQVPQQGHDDGGRDTRPVEGWVRHGGAGGAVTGRDGDGATHPHVAVRARDGPVVGEGECDQGGAAAGLGLLVGLQRQGARARQRGAGGQQSAGADRGEGDGVASRAATAGVGDGHVAGTGAPGGVVRRHQVRAEVGDALGGVVGDEDGERRRRSPGRGVGRRASGRAAAEHGVGGALPAGQHGAGREGAGGDGASHTDGQCANRDALSPGGVCGGAETRGGVLRVDGDRRAVEVEPPGERGSGREIAQCDGGGGTAAAEGGCVGVDRARATSQDADRVDREHVEPAGGAGGQPGLGDAGQPGEREGRSCRHVATGRAGEAARDGVRREVVGGGTGDAAERRCHDRAAT